MNDANRTRQSDANADKSTDHDELPKGQPIREGENSHIAPATGLTVQGYALDVDHQGGQAVIGHDLYAWEGDVRLYVDYNAPDRVPGELTVGVGMELTPALARQLAADLIAAADAAKEEEVATDD